MKRNANVKSYARHVTWLSATGTLLVGITSCGHPSQDGQQQPHPATDTAEEAIIFGVSASSTALNHTGALVAVFPGEVPEQICTGTLIAPETVVTAKHCVDILPYIEDSGYTVAFAIGVDSTAPEELIGVAGYATSPGDSGGFVGYGRDVAVLHLDHAPTTPTTYAEPRLMTDSRVGDSMITIGYGVHGATGAFDGRRRIGRETVTAVEGNTFEAIFGDFESFVEWWFTGQVTDADYLENVDPSELDYLYEFYTSLELYPEHEAVTGADEEDTQSCYGDSGGPLMRVTREGTWATYGVVSGGFNSLRLTCDFGTVFSTFGPESLDFLRSAREWEDPCGDVTQGGACDNGYAVRCESDLTSGVREVVEEDCIAQDEQCVVVDGNAACGTVFPADRTRRRAVRLDIQKLVRERFTRDLGQPWLAE